MMWKILEKISRKQVRFESKSAIVSFTFDDAPVSAFRIGGSILEHYGFRGTYYVSSGLINQDAEVGKIADLTTLTDYQKKGHEIANHTYDHLDCKKFGPFRMIRSVRKNIQKLDNIVSSNFSYPYGAMDSAARFAGRLCTSSARGISFGINKGMIDLTQLKAVRVYSQLGIEKCLDVVDECASLGGWLIFYTHDVCDEPSDYGCTPDQLTELVQAVYRENLTVLTVKKALEIIL